MIERKQLKLLSTKDLKIKTLFHQATFFMLASRLLCGVRRLAPRQGLASPRRLLCTPAATPPPPPPPLAAEPGMVAHIMKQLGSEVTTGLSKTRWLSLRPAGTPEAAISADHASGYCGLPQARLDPEANHACFPQVTTFTESQGKLFGFFGACCNWFLGLSAVYGATSQGPEVISLPMTCVMLCYSTLFGR